MLCESRDIGVWVGGETKKNGAVLFFRKNKKELVCDAQKDATKNSWVIPLILVLVAAETISSYNNAVRVPSKPWKP